MTATRQKQQPLDILVEDLSGSLWVAAIRKNSLSALEIDPYAEIVRWGSVYHARVIRIDASLNAAFVDLGHGLTGMLPADEIPGLAKGAKIGRRLRAGQFVTVQVKTARQVAPDDDEDGDQAPDSGKASRVSMDIALQGRFLIYTPLSPGNRVSRRIKDPAVRKQLTAMVKDIREVNGCILRASAAHTQTDMLVREAKIQKAIWESLLTFADDPEPALLMLGPDALQRVLADFATSQISSIQIADEDRHEEADTWCDLYAPELMTKLQSRKIEGTRNGMGLIESYDLLGQVEGLFRPYAVLPSGGALIIQETALGTVIDVNTAGAKSAAAVNTEAAVEIARQIRLRNLGGAILVDFAGFSGKAEQKRLSAALVKAFDSDSCTVELHGVTHLGLFEISRHRRTPSLMDRAVLMQGEE